MWEKIIFFISITCTIFFLNTNNLSGQLDFNIAPGGYLNGKGISILTYHNNYMVGKQGAIEIIQYDRRIMSNGMVLYQLKDQIGGGFSPEYFSQPIPDTKPVKPVVDKENRLIRINFEDTNVDLNYDIVVKGQDSAFVFIVDFKRLPKDEILGELSFEIELFPGFYRGKSFVFDDATGTFPLNFHHPVSVIDGNYRLEPMGQGQKLVIAPESPRYSLEISCKNGVMELLDTRVATNHNWYTLKARMDLGKIRDEEFVLTFKPAVIENYMKKPVLSYSQIGYHPDQKKEIVIEADHNYRNSHDVILYKYDLGSGSFKAVASGKPEFWGKYNRYHMYTYDFTDIKDEGLYYLSLENETKTLPFRISKDVYTNGAWQPALETFLPVQMCHMRIRDRNRIWHGCCHMDDAMQAPAPLVLFDGFSQGDSTDTPYKPFETIPGLNKGGWHDAGDDDVNSSSTGRTVYHLALIKEEFNIDTDQTSIDFDTREVFLHKPDGESDLVQQMKHGLDFLLRSYESAGHGIVGVISNSFDTYIIPGTWGHMTDQLFYDPGLTEYERTASHSGKKDDRYAFTNKDTRAEYRNVWVFTAASRALKGTEDSLANVCIRLAERIWRREMETEPVYYKSVGVPDKLEVEQISAAVELFLSTGKTEYIDFIEDNINQVYKNMEATCWTVARIADKFEDKSLKSSFENRLRLHSDSLLNAFASNPYGTYLDAELWGYGWDILWRTYRYYYLFKHYPELFPFDPVLNCNEFMLGKHPYSNVSYVSGVGTKIPIPAFGMNRSDYSYIPGGVFSGVNLIEPDFPELLEDHPFIWQQSEYIIHGATPYIFTILAADKYYNKD